MVTPEENSLYKGVHRSSGVAYFIAAESVCCGCHCIPFPTFAITTVPKGSCFLDSTVRTLKICVARVKGRFPTFLPTVVSAAQLCPNSGISLDTKMSQKATVKKIKRKTRCWETLLPRIAKAIRRQFLPSLADNASNLCTTSSRTDVLMCK